SDALLGELAWLATQLELELPIVRLALQRARKAGVRTALTPAPARPLDHALLADVDLLVPNQLEAVALTGIDDPLLAAAKLSETCRDVVVTLGADGAAWATGGQVVRQVPGRPVEAVDTTAAGDTFVGVLLTLLAEGAPMSRALDAATTAASIAVTRPGATSSMPTRAEIEAGLSET
ncbi:MAG: bifunctional hydroxymethylpyrimidine kinase/phosphomethylpyrimidine kinase, partial [Propionibacteriaceae bacterium]|nr:bifunctional hydroxymethylpyrimidine kinase/phosphomethylpyrimidine kinase [Propionibacteriaceae bacterium]